MMSGVFPHMLAGRLQLPSVSGVIRIENITDKKIFITREIEGGRLELLKVSLPAIFAFQAGINSPSYPNVLRMLKSDESCEEIIQEKDLPEKKHAWKISSINLPQKTREGKFINGSSEEKAKSLIKILKNKNLIKRD